MQEPMHLHEKQKRAANDEAHVCHATESGEGGGLAPSSQYNEHN